MNKAEYDQALPLLSDIEWRLDNLYSIKDKHGKIVRFVRNESQLFLWEGRHVLNIILKDRQRGFSTFIAILILDTCFFNKNQECGIIDLTLDDGKKKLAKIRLAYESLPDQLKMLNKLVTDNKETLEWENGSSVYTGTSHRGGTLQILHVSELGPISARNPEKAREVRTGAMNTLAPGSFLFIESTSAGRSGEFFDICNLAIGLRDDKAHLTDLDFKFFFFGWWMEGNENEIDPAHVSIPPKLVKYFNGLEDSLGITINARKRAWYSKKDAQQKGDMYREFPATPEEAFDASIEGAYLTNVLLQMRSNDQIGVIPHDPEYEVNSGWDIGINDQMTIWFHQYIALQHRFIGYISGADEDVLFYWQKMRNMSYLWGKHYLPHDAGQRRAGTARTAHEKPRTLEDILHAAGMTDIEVVPRIDSKITAINEVKLFLPKCFISTSCDNSPSWNNEKKYKGGLQCLKNFKRTWNDGLDMWEDKPVHDWAQHGYDGIETLIRGINAFGLKTATSYNQNRESSYAY